MDISKGVDLVVRIIYLWMTEGLQPIDEKGDPLPRMKSKKSRSPIRVVPEFLVRAELHGTEYDAMAMLVLAEKKGWVRVAPNVVVVFQSSSYLLPDGRRLEIKSGRLTPQTQLAIFVGGEVVQRYAWSSGPGPERYELTAAGIERAVALSDTVELPAWQRLKIIKQTGGNDIVQLDGCEHRVSSSAEKLLNSLQRAKGTMVLGTILTQSCGERPDRVYNSLPPELQSTIERPGKGKSGYRML